MLDLIDKLILKLIASSCRAFGCEVSTKKRKLKPEDYKKLVKHENTLG